VKYGEKKKTTEKRKEILRLKTRTLLFVVLISNYHGSRKQQNIYHQSGALFFSNLLCSTEEKQKTKQKTKIKNKNKKQKTKNKTTSEQQTCVYYKKVR